MDAKWTPGPHTIIERRVLVAFEGAEMWISIPELGATICIPEECDVAVLERARADMRRAAAAPKMYEALRKLTDATLALTMRSYRSGEHGEVIVPDPDAFRGDIRAAAAVIRESRAILADAERR